MHESERLAQEQTSDFHTLVALLRARARAQPDVEGYAFLGAGSPGPSLTYGQLDRRARALAQRLQSLDAAGERALLLFPPGLEFIEAFFGCLYAGTIAVPAPAPGPANLQRSLRRLAGIARDARAAFVVTTQEIHELLAPASAELGVRHWLVTDALAPGAAERWQEPAISAESLAFLQYTSGSTGNPKGVMVSHGNVLHNSAYIRQGFQHSAASIAVCWLPSFHDMGLIDGIIQPLYSGFPCHLMSPVAFVQHPLAWLEAISRLRATHGGGPNFAYDLCVRRTRPEQRAALDLRSWQVAYSGAEPVRPETFERFSAAFAVAGFDARAFYPCYGLAEATLKVSGGQRGHGYITCQVRAADLEQHEVVEGLPAERNLMTLVGCGQIGGGVEVAIVHPDSGERASAGQVGEIWVSGPSIARGYWDRPEDSERTFGARLAHDPERSFLRTGDLGFVREGELFITGRLKDLIIVDGRNHYPQDIEHTVRASHPLLEASTCAAFGVDDHGDHGEERVVIAVELGRQALRRIALPAAEGAESLGESLVRAIRRGVAEQHELPVWRVLLLRPGAVPRTSSGKVQRRSCRDRFLAGELAPLVDDVAAAAPAPEDGAPRPPGSAAVAHDGAALALARWLETRVSELCGGGPVERARPLAELGLGSRELVSLSGELSAELGRSLPATFFWDYPSIDSVARYLAGEAPGAPGAAAVRPATREPLALIGLGCRFPGAAGVEAFRELVRTGARAITEIPPERWAASAFFDADPDAPGKMTTRWGGFLPGIEGFDAHFFGISPREAREMDPQQRLLLEVAWEALEHAGVAPDTLAGSRTGVFVGLGASEYGHLRNGALEHISPYSGTGSMASVAAGRLSYVLGLEGPSLAVDTACSSSLVAFHLACRSLAEHECDLALVGGVNVLLAPAGTVALSRLRAMSPTGRCRPFDADADGYVRGEGCGVVVLERLADARARGDRVLALVRGSAMNNDGRSNGLTAPSGHAQEAVIRQALAQAGVRPAEVGYVEAHGTGTPLGDPIEVQALLRVLGEGRPAGERVALGSVKASIGHLEAAAGIAGLIKAVLVLDSAELPPQPELRRLNPHIPWSTLPVRVAGEPLPWLAPGGRRIAGVSAFGFSGTNAHVVLEAPPAPPLSAEGSATPPRPWHLLCLSARGEAALAALARCYQGAIAGASAEQLADICATALAGRAHFEHRLALVVDTAARAGEALATAASGQVSGPVPGQVSGQVSGPNLGQVSGQVARGRIGRGQAPRVAFLFTGQGALHAGAGRQLHDTSTVFRDALERCDELLRPHWQRPVREVLYPEPGAPDWLADARYAQPALLALQVALVELWRSWGIEPVAVLGHSLGEYAAAWAAGVLSLPDALALVMERARLMQALPVRGAMAAVLTGEAGVAAVLAAHPGRLALAAVNAPALVALSGDEPALAAALDTLAAGGVASQRLGATHAFHSPLMDPVLEPFERFAAAIPAQAPARALVTGLTGALLDAGKPPGAGHWSRQLREPVRFAEGVGTLRELGCDAFVEVGPRPVLLGLGRRCAPDPALAWLPTLERGPDDWKSFFGSLGTLYVRGARVAGTRGEQHAPRRRVALPTYPFEHKRYWLDAAEKKTHAMATSHTPPTWSRKPHILAELRELLAELLQTELELIDERTPLLELGADSISLLHAINAVEARFGVKLSVRQLFEEITTLDAVAEHIARHVAAPASVTAPAPAPVMAAPIEAAPPPPPPSPVDARPLAPAPAQPQVAALLASAAAGVQAPADTARARVVIDELVSQLAEALRAQLLDTLAASPAQGREAGETASAAPPAAILPSAPLPAENPAPSLAERQQAHLAALIERYTRRTRGSKQYAQAHRPVMADLRSVVGFRPSVKEMVYPLVKGRSRGARLWDIDGNEYVDISLGFGVHLLGHGPPLIAEAVHRQLEQGIELGPRSEHAGPVAALIARLTGMERVAFCSSGTEAVSLAIRLARAATGRTRIVMFSGAYHGHADVTLAAAARSGSEPGAVPAAIGIPQGAVEDVLVVPYGDPRSLDIIAAHAAELAAVLVEPVQSRYPALQPVEFLQNLRALTEAARVPLVFDEMITGFRIHPGGAQAHFGVRADLATYGKIIGGGMPIGVVAGRQEFLDRLDGGMWSYGDDSRPRVEHTYFAGTFAMHPLTMASARAVLEHLEASGPALQETLNRRTEELATTLDDLFRRQGAPIQVARFGSLFRFEFSGNRDALFFHLVEKGVYTWEGRSCFLSTAHTDEDLELIVKAVADSVREMQEGGFLPEPRRRAAASQPVIEGRALAPWPRRRAAGHETAAEYVAPPGRPLDFSLYFFGDYDAAFHEDKYRLLVEGTRFADEHGFRAVWLPERHFHSFGGLSPNPSVLAAALALTTRRIHLRAGSVVVPLHHPVRIAEEWAMVDNLSRGRAGVAIASGWHANDFVLAPAAFDDRRARMLEGIQQVRTLWSKGALTVPGPKGKDVEVALVPRPVQAELPLWVSVVNNPDTYRLAGEHGFGVLTSLMTQSLEELGGNLALYRKTLAAHGHADRGHVTVLIHAYLGADLEQTRQHAQRPFIDYLRSSVGLFSALGQSQGAQVGFDQASAEDIEYLYSVAYQRYLREAALIGTVASSAPVVERLRRMGVDEVSCLVDFGVATEDVLASLPHLDALRQEFQIAAAEQRREEPASPAVASRAPVRLPLTEAQRQLWLLAQLGAAGSAAYNLVSALELEGPVRVDALRRCLAQLADRHEALRTVILADGEGQEISQEIRQEMSIPLELADISGLAGEARDAAAAALLAEDSQRPFELARGPLLRARLIRIAPERHLLVLAVHHILIDGWSLGVLGHELCILYTAACRSVAPGLAPAVQFRAWMAWQREHEGSAEYAAAEAFWMAQLSTAVPDLDLPTDRPRPATSSMRGARQTGVLAPELVAALKDFSRRSGCTPFMTLCAAYLVLLHRLSGQNELLIGCPASGRLLEAHAALIGYCTHLLPLRSQYSAQERFIDFLRGVRHRLLEAYEHQSYPFARLVEKARAAHDPLRAPLLRAVFNLERPLALPPLHELRASFHSVPIHHTQFELSLNVLEEDGAMVLSCDYDRDLFDAASIARLLAAWQTLLSGAIAEPSRRVSRLPLLGAAERQLLRDWNRSAAPFADDACIHHLFESWAERTPEAPALAMDGRTLSYGEVNRRANQLAWFLRAQGVGAEVVVGLCIERSLDMVIAILATLKAGGAYLPLDPDYPPGRLAFMVEDARPRLILTGGAAASRAWDGVPCRSLEEIAAELASQATRNPEASISASNLAYIIYTSGSTGRPKGVLVPHRGVCNFVQALIPALAITPSSRVLQFSSPSFDFSVHEMLSALGAGATLCVASAAARRLGEPLVALLGAERVTHMSLTPSVLATISPQGLEHIEVVAVAGEACPPELVSRWSPGRRMFNLYGPTETSVWATFAECVAEGRRPAIGRPLRNLHVHVLDDQLEPVPIGVTGELYVGGVGVARGYLARPRLTAERFVPVPPGLEPAAPGERLYRTGDMVRWRADGTLDYLGRRDHQVKLRGMRVELGEVEAQLARQPGVHEAVVVVGESSAGDPQLVACVVPHPGVVVSPDELCSGLGEHLPPYMLPSSVLVLSALPRNPSGKIDRKALRAPRVARARDLTPARSETEKRLVELWSAALGRERVGIHESFFEIGGHSLLAVRLAARIEAAFGKKISPSLLLEAGTIARLAERLAGPISGPAGPISGPSGPISGSGERWCAVRLHPGDGARPFFLVHPIGGHVLCYAALARALGGGRAIYGLRALGLEEDAAPLDRVEAMAACYLHEIRRLQPAGPYLIGGWSFGGTVALEMAQRLRAEGETVSLLAIIDSPFAVPGASLAALDERALLEHVLRDLESQESPGAELAGWAALLEETRGSSPPRGDLAGLRAHVKVFRANAAAHEAYRPRPYGGRVVLIQAQASDDELGRRWRDLVTGPFEAHVLPGDHFSLLREGVKDVAARLAQALGQARRVTAP